MTILQKTLRGRLDQTQMLDGKKMSSELIKELRSTHALLKNEQDVITAKKECTLAGQRDKKFFEDKVGSFMTHSPPYETIFIWFQHL